MMNTCSILIRGANSTGGDKPSQAMDGKGKLTKEQNEYRVRMLSTVSQLLKIIYYVTLVELVVYKVKMLTEKDFFSWSKLILFTGTAYMCDARYR